jgi:putative mRNA 3-end processing factor
VLGSAQLRIEADGEVWVVSGDYKRVPDPTCAPFEPLRADVFLTEATFGLPVFRWEPTDSVIEDLLGWWETNRQAGRASLVFCHVLGKSQRLLGELALRTDRRVFAHGAIAGMCDVYREAGVRLLPLDRVADTAKGKDFAGELVLAPITARGTPWMRRFGDAAVALVSGFMRVRGERRRRSVDRGFALSDHSDWPALLDTIRDTGARRVLVTHGYAVPLAQRLRELGFEAEALETPYGRDQEEVLTGGTPDEDLGRRIGIGVLALLVTAVVVAIVDARGQLPNRSTPRIPGLRAPVEVTFDAGHPTVRAWSLADALRVEGFLQARDRLFQMELARRVAAGEVSTLVVLPRSLDRRQRVYGLPCWPRRRCGLPSEEQEDAQALADGINAFIASRPGHWGLEFQLLALEPRPWTPADSIRVLLLMHQQLSESWEHEVMAEALAALPAARRNFLLPEVSTDDVLVVPDAEPRPAPSTAGLLTRGAPSPPPVSLPPRPEPLEVLGVPLQPSGGAAPAEVGSNGWVIAGAHTARGKPILADDLHLGFTVPGTWYPMRIELLAADGAVERWVQGVSLPGLPGVVVFQNERLAIGFTNTGTDVQDLYREPAVDRRVERIEVKGGPAQTLEVSIGRHGPMVRPGLALHWAALDASTLRLPVRKLNLATDWASFNAAADDFLGPGQNILYADVDGHIGWRATGVLPLRAAGDDGRLPRDGVGTGHDWSGYLPQSRMPRVLDPPSGRVVTANQRLIGTASGLRWPSAWASPTRARRIRELVSGEAHDALGPGDAAGHCGHRPSRGRGAARPFAPSRAGEGPGRLGWPGQRRLTPVPGRRGGAKAGLPGDRRRRPEGLHRHTRGARLVQQRPDLARRSARLGGGVANGRARRSGRRPRRGAARRPARGAHLGRGEPARGTASLRSLRGRARLGLQPPRAPALRMRSMRPGGHAAVRAEHALRGRPRGPGGNHAGSPARDLEPRRSPHRTDQQRDWLEDLDGQRTGCMRPRWAAAGLLP